jgi:hypothetical protein
MGAGIRIRTLGVGGGRKKPGKEEMRWSLGGSWKSRGTGDGMASKGCAEREGGGEEEGERDGVRVEDHAN